MKKKNKKFVFILVILLALLISTFLLIYYKAGETCIVGNKMCVENSVVSCTDNNKYTKIDVCDFNCINGECDKTECTDCQISNIKDFSNSYKLARKNANISDEYLLETTYYDYNNIDDDSTYKYLLTQIPFSSGPTEASKLIGKTIYNRLQYNISAQTGNYCYGTSGSEVLANGYGVCGTMSRVDIMMLRKFGIAARAVTGCVKLTNSCNSMTIFTDNLNRMVNKNLIKENNKYIIGGVLHGWVEVWLPETGWTYLESTNGELYPNSCVSYDVMAREPDFTNEIDECGVILSKAQKCLVWQ